MASKTENILIQVSALRKAFDDLAGGLEAQLTSDLPPRQRRNNKKFERKVDMAARFNKYNKK